MKKNAMNAEPRANSGQRDSQGKGVRKQRRTKMTGGISEYIKMLKKSDLARPGVRSTFEPSDYASASNTGGHRNRFRSVSSVKSLRASSLEKGWGNKVNQKSSVVLAQEYKAVRVSKSNSRKSSATRPVNILNNSAYSLHSSLSAALSRGSRAQLAQITEAGGSRNNSNGYKTSFKASAVTSLDQQNLGTCLS